MPHGIPGTFFASRKRRHNSESLNRRESYIHEKMNASDFFNLWLKKFRLTLVIVAAYRNWDILGVDLSIFVSWGRFLRNCCDQL